MPNIELLKEEILASLNVEDVYGGGLLGSTKGWKRKCPFHEDRKPSLHIWKDDLNFKCFGCGERGSAFDFLMKTENMDFAAALRKLADEAGVDISFSDGKYKRLFEVNSLAQEFFSRKLRDSPGVIQYLRGRGIKDEDMGRFRLGFAPGNSLAEHMRMQGVGEEDLLAAKLVIRKNGKIRDFFYNRVMFPIVEGGSLKSFGGRLLDGDGPKYLNTGNTPIFRKKSTLYGLASHAIREMGYAIVVEGYMDVIACHAYGYRNAVAALGTELSDSHIRKLRKHCQQVVLVFDGDRAGDRAAERAVKHLFDSRVRGSVMVLPEGEDPDSCLRSGRDFDELIRTATPLAVFLATRFPNTRNMLYHQMLARHSASETAEFLAYMGTEEETGMFLELSARSLLEEFVSSCPVVCSGHGIEVRRFNGYLAVFSRGKFLTWKKCAENVERQAEGLIRGIVKLRGRGKGRE